MSLTENLEKMPPAVPKSGEIVHRPGSRVAKARNILGTLGRSAEAMEILEAIGEDLSTANHHNLACTLRACVRKGKIFTRTAPCTFGLLEFAGSSLPPQPRQAGRPGTRIAKARTFLKTLGRPAEAMEILEAIGEDLSTANRHGLACTLRACVRKGKIFTRTAPCTFGLLEFAGSSLPPQPRQAGRPGTRIAKARTFLNTVGRPAQVMEILEAIGEDLNLPNRHGLYATLQASVHKGEIFTQTAPYTFGLLEFADANR